MSMGMFAGVPGKIKTLLERLTDTRAANLENLDAAISSRASTSVVAKAATWTQTLADKIDLNLDGKISAIRGYTIPQYALITAVGAGNWTIPALLAGDTIVVTMIAGGGSGCTRNTNTVIQGGCAGEYLIRQRYTLSGAEISAGQVAYDVGDGAAAETMSTSNGNVGDDTVFGVWTVQGGLGGDRGGSNQRGPAGGLVDLTNNRVMAAPQAPQEELGGHGGLNSLTQAGGAGGLILGPGVWDLSLNGGDGVGYGSGGASSNNSSGGDSLAGLQGAILIEYDVFPS